MADHLPKYTDEHTDDAFLGGRLQVLQPKRGLRAGSDAVFLAAAVTAQVGERVLDVGTGSGIVALCLASRLPGVAVDALEIQPQFVDLARQNAARNGFDGRIAVHLGDVGAPPPEVPRNAYTHVVTNPPYYDAAATVAPPDAAKATAHVEGALGTAQWMRACLKFLKPKGWITAIHRADRLGDVLSGLSGRAGDIVVYPLWPRAGAAAVRVIVRARKGGRGPLTLHPGLVLHGPGGGFTDAAEQVLRHGDPLLMSGE